MPSAAVLIIGNEILTGKFADENGPWLIGRLRALGCDLKRLIVIPDEEPTIAEEVRRAAAAHDLVITTGGVGPTHDDVTMGGVARGLGVPVLRHPELETLLRARMGDRCNAAALRMADVPEGALLVWEGQRGWPLVVAGNVHIFPGVPVLLREKFDGVAKRFAGTPVRTARLRTLRSEPEIAEALTEAASRWPSVDMGSYPRFETVPRSVILTLESRDALALGEALSWLRAAVPDAELLEGS